jgi:hypothetical protein
MVFKRGAPADVVRASSPAIPPWSVGRAIATRPAFASQKALPLQLSGLDAGDEIGLVDPDPSSAEVVRLEGAVSDETADLPDRLFGDVRGLLDVEEPANRRPAGGVLVLGPVRHASLSAT